LHIKLGKPIGEPVEYWRLRFETNHSHSEQEWIELLDERLEETVRAHLVSDVPFGAFLSGGLDSSTVVAYMSRILKTPVEAFCIGHPDANFDEKQWAMEAAAATGANFNFQLASIANLEILPTLISHYGEPFADSSAIPTWLVSQFARTKVKMVLSGDGGDELFAGYHAYPAILYDCRVPRSSLQYAKYQMGNLLRKLRIRPAIAGLEELKYRRTGLFTHEERRSLWREEYREITEETRADFHQRARRAKQRHPLDTLQAFDIQNYLPFDNLTKVDIASMCHGLEVRVPLLDHKFLEFVATIPPQLRLHPDTSDNSRLESLSNPYACTGKYLPKKNAERFFSKTFIDRPKRGFEVPIQSWLSENTEHRCIFHLQSTSSKSNAYLRPEATSELLQQASIDKISSWKAWEILVLKLFLEKVI
jgi:asparagine synthase (glutamine-hydrolysing)